MNTSKHIAGLVGPTLVALGLSELMNFHIWAINVAPVTYLNGTLLFIAGLAIVRVHNRWTLAWPVLVTLVGWVAILGGLYRMFAPDAPQASENPATRVGLSGIAALGAFLTFKAYGPRGRSARRADEPGAPVPADAT